MCPLFGTVGLVLLGAVGCIRAQAVASADGAPCGQVFSVQSRANSVTRYAYSPPKPVGSAVSSLTLVLLPGGSGRVNLNEQGCARELKGNSLVRSISLWNAMGVGTALVDAPSDQQGEDGLAGFRIAPEHAQDLAQVIAELRSRTTGAVWVVGTSRGSISAANVAARLSGTAAPDGVVLTSALMVGQTGAKKTWVAQTVFDLPLEQIRMPLLLVGHEADKCLRSPAQAMGQIAQRVGAARKQVVLVTGGPGYAGVPGLAACEGRAPHGFVEQEQEVAAGIVRFAQGSDY